MGVPYLFRCPISLDLFTDPVTLCTGQTYDRHSIERWLQAGNRTCPVTMQLLCDTTLVPNHNLRHLIEQWLLTNPGMNQQVEPLGLCSNPRGDLDLQISLSTIRSILESESSAADLKIDMLREIMILLIESDVNEASMIQSGFFPLLLQLIFQYPMDLAFSNLELIELSLDSLFMLSPTNHLDSLNKILANDNKLVSLVLLLSHGSAKVKTSLCCLLEIIALSEQTQELTLIIGQSPHVIRALVAILHNSADPPTPDACVRALKGLCSLEANKENAIREGVVHGLTSYLSENSTMNGDSSKALETLECLLENERERSNLEKTKNLIRVLVKHIFVVSSENEGSEYAVSVLLNMCYDSEWACDKSISVGVVTQLLLLIQSQCSARAKTKARQLLKLLQLKDKVSVGYN